MKLLNFINTYHMDNYTQEYLEELSEKAEKGTLTPEEELFLIQNFNSILEKTVAFVKEERESMETELSEN